jgi:hypothetical protein
MKQQRQNKRDATRIIHEHHHLLTYCPPIVLAAVARGIAKQYTMPRKVALKAMARYARLHYDDKSVSL